MEKKNGGSCIEASLIVLFILILIIILIVIVVGFGKDLLGFLPIL